MRTLQARITQFRSLCSEIIRDRKKTFDSTQASQTSFQKDLLDLFLIEQVNKTEYAFTDEEIIDEFVSFFLAGMDTTGHLVAAMCYNLHHNPQHFEALRKEVDQYYKGKSPQELTMEDLNSMETMSLVIKESLRIMSSVPILFTREAVNDHSLGDFKVKKGTYVNVGMIYNNNNPKYHDNPEKFDIYRWVNGKSKNAHPFATIPFSAGGRNCIGQHLSQIETKIMFSEYLLRYDFKISEGFVDVMTVRFLTEHYYPLTLDLTKRKN